MSAFKNQLGFLAIFGALIWLGRHYLDLPTFDVSSDFVGGLLLLLTYLVLLISLHFCKGFFWDFSGLLLRLTGKILIRNAFTSAVVYGLIPLALFTAAHIFPRHVGYTGMISFVLIYAAFVASRSIVNTFLPTKVSAIA